MEKFIQKSLYLLLAFFVLMAACTEDPDQNPQGPQEPEEPPVNFMDTASLETIIRNIENYVPTWEELERFTDDAEFLEIPAFGTVAASWYDPTGPGDPSPSDVPYLTWLLDYNASLVEDFNANMSSALFTTMPPYEGPNGGEIVVPYPPDILDERLRASTVLFLREKSFGLPTTMVNFYPPFIEMEEFPTRAAFEEWFENRFLPEKEAEAKAAEIMKAEKYIPWPVEFEILIRQFGGIDDDGFMAGKSEEEILTFANYVKDRIFNTIKPHYSGRIVAHLYNNYQLWPEQRYWSKMSYSEFDDIYFAFFPPFNIESTGDYMDVQLEYCMKIIENSGGKPWYASEVSVFEWYVEDGKMAENEKGMYEVAFNKLETARIPMSGMTAAGGYMQTEAARQYLKEYFASK